MASKSIYLITETIGSNEKQIDAHYTSSDAKMYAKKYSQEKPSANYSITKSSLVGVYQGGNKVPQFETKN